MTNNCRLCSDQAILINPPITNLSYNISSVSDNIIDLYNILVSSEAYIMYLYKIWLPLVSHTHISFSATAYNIIYYIVIVVSREPVVAPVK